MTLMNDDANIQKLAQAILVYIPAGSMQPGDVEDVDMLSLMTRTGFTRKQIEDLASSTRLAKLVGVTRTSYIKPTTKGRKDKGAVRVRSK